MPNYRADEIKPLLRLLEKTKTKSDNNKRYIEPNFNVCFFEKNLNIK